MNPDEAVAYRYLCRQFGPVRVVYEPNGNIPPDFAVQEGPAVEVRRLNRNDFSGESPKGIEESFIPRWNSVCDFFPTLGPPRAGRSWFVVLRLRSPRLPWRALLNELRDQLSRFQAAPESHPLEWEIADGVRIELIACSNPQEHAFLLCSMTDGNQAYWVVSELITNIRYCSEEKLAKIAPYRSRYDEWWLVLVDHISFGPFEEDVAQLREHFARPSGWSKIIVVGGEEAGRVSEI